MNRRRGAAGADAVRRLDARQPAAHDENVEVYSNCEEVELLLNGKSLGSKPLPADAAPRIWQVPFEAGTLRAIGTQQGAGGGHARAAHRGQAGRIVLAADRDTLARIGTMWRSSPPRVVDDNGVPVPGADHDRVRGDGPGRHRRRG